MSKIKNVKTFFGREGDSYNEHTSSIEVNIANLLDTPRKIVSKNSSILAAEEIRSILINSVEFSNSDDLIVKISKINEEMDMKIVKLLQEAVLKKIENNDVYMISTINKIIEIVRKYLVIISKASGLTVEDLNTYYSRMEKLLNEKNFVIVSEMLISQNITKLIENLNNSSSIRNIRIK